MKKLPSLFIISLTLPFFAGACADRMTRSDTAQTQNAFSSKVSQGEESNEKLVSASVSFARGSAVLSQSARQELRNLIQSAKAQGDIEDIKVAVWSDRDYPASDNVQLTSVDERLAERRADAIEDHLEDVLDTPSVETFTMTERANWLARMFRTDEAELKSSFARRNEPVSEGKYQLLRKGGASKATVVIETEID